MHQCSKDFRDRDSNNGITQAVVEHSMGPSMQVTLLRTLIERFLGWILPFVLITIVIDTPINVILVFTGIVFLLELGFLLVFWKIPLHSACGHFNMLYFTVLVFSGC